MPTFRLSRIAEWRNLPRKAVIDLGNRPGLTGRAVRSLSPHSLQYAAGWRCLPLRDWNPTTKAEQDIRRNIQNLYQAEDHVWANPTLRNWGGAVLAGVSAGFMAAPLMRILALGAGLGVGLGIGLAFKQSRFTRSILLPQILITAATYFGMAWANGWDFSKTHYCASPLISGLILASSIGFARSHSYMVSETHRLLSENTDCAAMVKQALEVTKTGKRVAKEIG